MALNLTVIEGHLARICSDIPISFTWDGVSYSGLRSTPDASQNLEIGGPEERIEFDLFVRASTLPATKPTEGQIFEFGTVKMKVLRVRTSPDNGALLAFSMGYARQGTYP